MSETRFVSPSLNAAVTQAKILNPQAVTVKRHVQGRKVKASGVTGTKVVNGMTITLCSAKRGIGPTNWTPRFVRRSNGPVGSAIHVHETNDGRITGGMPAQWEGEPSTLTRRQKMARKAIERNYRAEWRENHKWNLIADKRHFEIHGLLPRDRQIAKHVVNQTQVRTVQAVPPVKR